MNTKRNKRGFTIVELVVVIVVIAILAAVLIPTISSLITKANQSADIQAVNQINKLLATHVDGSVTDVSSAIKALAENNVDMDDYRALQNDHYFYFIMNGNTPMVVYCDKDYNVVYPKNVDITGIQLMSLTGEIPTDDSWETETTTDDNGNTVVTASISSGAQLADLMADYRTDANSKAKTVTKIKLTSDIDLKGSAETFGNVTSTLTIDGSTGTDGEYYTISGLRADSNTVVHQPYQSMAKKYQCYGLINAVRGGNVTIKNVNISDVVVTDSGNYNYGRSGLLIGNVYGKNIITIENVNINNCIVYGGDKAAALIGGTETDSSDSVISIKNVTVKDTTVLGAAYVAKAVACIWSNLTLTFENCDFAGVTVGVNEYAFAGLWSTNGVPDKNWNGNDITVSQVEKCAEEIKQNMNIDVSSNNMYLRYLGNASSTDKNITTNTTKYSYSAICTEDLYWLTTYNTLINSSTDTDGNITEARYYVATSGSVDVVKQ